MRSEDLRGELRRRTGRVSTDRLQEMTLKPEDKVTSFIVIPVNTVNGMWTRIEVYQILGEDSQSSHYCMKNLQKLYVPKEESIPIPPKHVDMTKSTHTKIVDTRNQLADILTRGSFTRDDWNHLRLLNAMNFSMFSCSQFLSKVSCSRELKKVLRKRGRQCGNRDH